MGRAPFSKLTNHIYKKCDLVKEKKNTETQPIAGVTTFKGPIGPWWVAAPLPRPTPVATPLIRAKIRAIEYMRIFVLQQLPRK